MNFLHFDFDFTEKLYSATRALGWAVWRLRVLALGFLTSFLLSACATTVNAPFHFIETKNTGIGELFEVEFDYVKPIVFRDMTPRKPGKTVSYGGDNPIPDVMPIRWKTSDGLAHSVHVSLRKKLSYANGGLGGIEIRFTDDKVEVYEITRSGAQREFRHSRRIYPE